MRLDIRLFRWSCLRRFRAVSTWNYDGVSTVLGPTHTKISVYSKRRFRMQNYYAHRINSRMFSDDGNGSKIQPAIKNNDANETENDEKPSKTKFFAHWIQQLSSPPNMITTARIFATPYLSYLILTHQYEFALAGCFLAGVSDVLDGFLARRYNMSTVLGTYLDPLADKVMINVLAVTLWYDENHILPLPLVLLWCGRDVGLMVATYWYVASNTRKGKPVMDPSTTPLKVEPTTISKFNTGLQFFTLGIGMISPVVALPDGALSGLCWFTGMTTVGSAFSYIGYNAFAMSGNNQSAPDDASLSKIEEGSKSDLEDSAQAATTMEKAVQQFWRDELKEKKDQLADLREEMTDRSSEALGRAKKVIEEVAKPSPSGASTTNQR